MSNTRSIDFDARVPSAARQKITELGCQPQSNPRPKGGTRSPCQISDYENRSTAETSGQTRGDGRAHHRLGIFRCTSCDGASSTPRPRKKSEGLEYVRRYLTVPTYEGAAELAAMLVKRMKETKSDLMDAVGHDLESERAFDKAFKGVEEIEYLYRCAHQERMALISDAELPSVTKKRSKSAPQVFFSRLMSNRLQEL